MAAEHSFHCHFLRGEAHSVAPAIFAHTADGGAETAFHVGGTNFAIGRRGWCVTLQSDFESDRMR